MKKKRIESIIQVGVLHMSEKNEQRKWDREEVVLLVSEYFRTKQLLPDIINENYRRISSILRIREMKITGEPIADIFRDYSGIRMQSGRIRCLDPETDYHGMTGTKLQKEIVEEYLDDPEKIKKEAEEIFKKYE